MIGLAVDVDDAFFTGADDGIAEEGEFGAEFGVDEDATVGIEVGFDAVVVGEVEEMFDLGGLVGEIFEEGEVVAPDGFGVDSDDRAIEAGAEHFVVFEVMSEEVEPGRRDTEDRKSTRLNSSHT